MLTANILLAALSFSATALALPVEKQVKLRSVHDVPLHLVGTDITIMNPTEGRRSLPIPILNEPKPVGAAHWNHWKSPKRDALEDKLTSLTDTTKKVTSLVNSVVASIQDVSKKVDVSSIASSVPSQVSGLKDEAIKVVSGLSQVVEEARSVTQVAPQQLLSNGLQDITGISNAVSQDGGSLVGSGEQLISAAITSSKDAESLFKAVAQASSFLSRYANPEAGFINFSLTDAGQVAATLSDVAKSGSAMASSLGKTIDALQNYGANVVSLLSKLDNTDSITASLNDNLNALSSNIASVSGNAFHKLVKGNKRRDFWQDAQSGIDWLQGNLDGASKGYSEATATAAAVVGQATSLAGDLSNIATSAYAQVSADVQDAVDAASGDVSAAASKVSDVVASATKSLNSEFAKATSDLGQDVAQVSKAFSVAGALPGQLEYGVTKTAAAILSSATKNF